MNRQVKRLYNIIKDPSYLLIYIAKRFPFLFPDKAYIRILYKGAFGRFPNLESPVTYNEKLQWLKLYDRDDRYSELVDKYEVKKIVSKEIGSEYVIPNLGVWERYDDINFDMLPNQFVLKCTHDSGSVVICKDKKTFDFVAAKTKLKKALSRNYYYRSREYPYKHIKPRIIAEPYLEDDKTGQLYDYKFFCFNGEPEFLFIASDRTTGAKFDYFDIDFNKLPMRQAVHPCSELQHKKPDCYPELLEMVKKLSKGLIQVRVDFYILNGKPLFGELTFFHHGGLVPFIPEEYDYIWGNRLTLPLEKRSTNE